jgi:hypothetical protein
MSSRLTRRRMLGALASVPWIPGAAQAFGDSARFIPAVAQHGGRWDARLSGLRRLAWELQRRTSVEVVLDARPFPLSSPKLFEYPFLYLGSDGPMPALKPDEVENLRRYLTYGGFVLADANDGSDRNGFDASLRREAARILPQNPLQPLPSDHVAFKSFFLLDSAPGRLLNKPYLEACSLGKRAALVYSQNDVAGAWNREESGDYEYEVTPGGEPQRELAIRLGINLCMYALCLDYKDDAVHLPLILQKRR